jgi:hypothetical protein
MKKNFITILFLIGIIQFAFAEWMSLSEKTEHKLFNHNGTNLQTAMIDFQLDGFEMNEISAENRLFQQISYWNEGQFIEAGMPELPRFSRLVAIPNTGTTRFEIIYSDTIEMDDILVYPFQGLRSESQERNAAFEINENFYQGGRGIFPDQIVQIGEPAIMRDLRVVLLTFNPFQYNPHTHKLLIHKNMQVKLVTEGNGGTNIKNDTTKISRAFEPLYESTVINYNVVTERNSSYQEPTYLFIYPNNSLVETDLQPLLTWKHQKGFIVKSVTTTTTGTSASQIKAYIQNAYNTWENRPEYICLVGDAGGTINIPTWYESWTTYNGEGDHPYTQLEGNDILADAIIGRLSINSTTDLQTIVNKILTYEKTPYMGNTSWFNRTLLVGDPSSSGQSCITTKKYVKELMSDNLPNMIYDEIYFGNSASQMSSSVNTGVSYFNYRGWMGMSGWSNTTTDNLNNGPMLPFVVTITCDTGSFSGTSDARSERFLKAGTPSTPKGGIASVGTATTGTHTTFNNCVDAGIFSGIFNDGITTPGGALVRGKLNLYISYPANPYNKVDVNSYWNNLMGDPGLDLWTSIPQLFTITYESQIPLGSNFVTIQVKNSQNFAVSNAWVSLLKGNDEIFVTGFSDVNGNVQLPISAISAGDVSLVVSKHDFKPAIHTFTIVQNSQFVNVQNIEINDDNIGNSLGNNDGNINPGERIELRIQLKNFGTSMVNGVSATISTSNQNVNILTATQNYGNIASNSAVYSLTDFVFEVLPSAINNEDIRFQISISDNLANSWQDTIVLTTVGANIQYQSYTASNAKNNDLYPGQTAQLAVTLKNIGGIVATNVTGELNCSHNGITITNPVAIFGDFNLNVDVTNLASPFEMEISNHIIQGTQIPCNIQLSGANGFIQTVYFTIEIGEVTVFDPLGPDDFGYYCYDQNDINYSLAPVYNWLEIDPNYGGLGTVLTMSDAGDTGALQTVTLPFRLQFYGIRYNTLTICSNGFVAPGGTEESSYMNWPIPGPLGPSPMIAPFWDDLRMGSGRVCYYSHPGNEYFVVQWSRLQNDYNGAEETFQLIIYNTMYYPSASGNNDLKFQYKVVNNVDVGDYSGSIASHGEYATVGIEDHTGTRGLQYTYSNLYPTAAAPLVNELALLFTTNLPTVLSQPEANFSQTELNVTMMTEQTTVRTVQISNAGEANLLYQVSANFVDSRVIEDNRAEGGPDSYGYSWKDSNQPGGPVYDWIEISTTGTALSLGDDQGVNVALPFTFNFYGQNKTSVMISSNGYLTFGSTGGDYTNDPVPSTSQPNDLIAPLWDDLKPIGWSGGYDWGSVYYLSDTANNRFIVQYQNVAHWHSSVPRDPETFQVILYANGKIKFQYKITTNESDTTIGIENSSGTVGLQVAYYNGTYLQNNLAILFQCVQDWATVNPQSGTVLGGETQDITIEIMTESLDLGSYLCELIISTNAPNAPNYIIPLHLNVVDAYLEIPQNVSLTQNGNQITIQWGAVSGATGYKIYTADSPETAFSYLTTVSTNTFSHTIAAAKMFYKIVAIN